MMWFQPHTYMPPPRIEFALIEIQIKKIFGDYTLTDPVEIDECCEFARTFIEACGWDVDSYIAKLMGHEPEN